jgi:hypothetical protein
MEPFKPLLNKSLVFSAAWLSMTLQMPWPRKSLPSPEEEDIRDFGKIHALQFANPEPYS